MGAQHSECLLGAPGTEYWSQWECSLCCFLICGQLPPVLRHSDEAVPIHNTIVILMLSITTLTTTMVVYVMIVPATVVVICNYYSHFN